MKFICSHVTSNYAQANWTETNGFDWFIYILVCISVDNWKENSLQTGGNSIPVGRKFHRVWVDFFIGFPKF